MELKIAHLYPDVLNLYGDRGNIICLQQRLKWRGIDSEVVEIPIGSEISLKDFDLFFIGGGQDFEQEILLNDLKKGKDKEIKEAIENGKTFLCICGGYQMLGNYYETYKGVKCEFLGAIDFYTKGDEVRMIGNYAYQLANSDITVVGFENHSGKTYLGEGVHPLGKVLKGHGNNGKDGSEGVHYKNVFGTYCHGPVLPKNPEFADMILRTALETKYGEIEFSKLEDKEEKRAHDSVMKQVMGEQLNSIIDCDSLSKRWDYEDQ